MTRSFDELRLALAQQLRRTRALRGLSQEALAFRAEIDRTYISQIERGIVNPSLQVLSRVAVALSVDVVDLLTDAGEEKYGSE